MSSTCTFNDRQSNWIGSGYIRDITDSERGKIVCIEAIIGSNDTSLSTTIYLQCQLANKTKLSYWIIPVEKCFHQRSRIVMQFEAKITGIGDLFYDRETNAQILILKAELLTILACRIGETQ